MVFRGYRTAKPASSALGILTRESFLARTATERLKLPPVAVERREYPVLESDEDGLRKLALAVMERALLDCVPKGKLSKRKRAAQCRRAREIFHWVTAYGPVRRLTFEMCCGWLGVDLDKTRSWVLKYMESKESEGKWTF